MKAYRKTLSPESLKEICRIAQTMGISPESIVNAVVKMRQAGMKIGKKDLSEASDWRPKSMDELTKEWRTL